MKNVYFSLNEAAGPNGNNKVTIGINPSYTGSSFNFSVNFLVDANGNLDSTPLQQKLGWIMGFRSPIYPVPVSIPIGANSYTSESHESLYLNQMSYTF